jgi:hypothetical protein
MDPMKAIRFGSAIAVLALLFAGMIAGRARGQEQIELLESEVRQLLPPDGELIQQGEVSKDFIGMALGRRVRAKGKQIYVSDENVGEQGVVFKENVIEVNIGGHAEKEVKVGPFKPTGAVDLAATVKLTISDDLKVAMEVQWHEIQGDNLGGKLVVAFAKDKVHQAAKAEVQKFADRLTEQIRKKVKDGDVKLRVRIVPGKLIITEA